MKSTIVIILFALFAIPKTTFGQIYMNAAAGINHTSFELTGVSLVFTPHLGYFIGFAPEYRFNEKIQILANFQYNVKGLELNSFSAITKFRFDYLDITPEIEYYIFDFLAVGVGANYGIKLSERFKEEGKDWTVPIANIIKSSDYGLTGKLKFRHNKVFCFARYNLGLKNIIELTFTDNNGVDLASTKQTSSNLQVGFGYNFQM